MGRPRKPTVADAVDFWVQAKLRSGPIGATSVHFAERFRNKMGDRKVMELTGADLMAYVDRGQGAPAQRREINTVKSIVNYYRKIAAHDQPIYVDRPRDNPGRMRWLTEQERDQFIEAVPDEMRPLVVALFYTGARKGELVNLKPENVVYGDRLLRLRTIKGKRAEERWRTVPIHDRLWPYVEGTENERLVFAGPDGKPWDSGAFRDGWWQTVVGLGWSDLKPHDARHTFASLLVKQGVGLRTVADLLGHSTMAMVMRYTHVDVEDNRSAVLTL